MGNLSTFRAAAGAILLSTVSGPAAEPEKPLKAISESDPQTQALDRRENQRENAMMMQSVRAALKADNPEAALKAILPHANDPEKHKILKTLRAEEKADLLSVDSATLAKLMGIEDPSKAKPALEKLIYDERSLKAAGEIRAQIDAALKDGPDAKVIEKIRGAAGNLSREMPGLLTNGSYGSEKGLKQDLEAIHSKLPADNQLVQRAYQAMLREFGFSR